MHLTPLTLYYPSVRLPSADHHAVVCDWQFLFVFLVCSFVHCVQFSIQLMRFFVKVQASSPLELIGRCSSNQGLALLVGLIHVTIVHVSGVPHWLGNFTSFSLIPKLQSLLSIFS